jgi:hypothetical protein
MCNVGAAFTRTSAEKSSTILALEIVSGKNAKIKI